MKDEKNIIDKDNQFVWHPLTQHKTQKHLLQIVKAKDSLLYDNKGNSYIDAISSWYTCMYGHCNKRLVKAISKQAKILDQIIFSGFTHKNAVLLAEKLLKILPSKMGKVFYSDNGSTAVEVAIKMGLQFHHNNNNKRDTLLAFEDGFHGDTFGAMSVSGLSVYNGPFKDFSLKVIRLPKPNGVNNAKVLKTLNHIIEKHDIAAFIYEPLIQGAAGMKTYSKSGLEDILSVCIKNKIITIADEVMTGFGKTGTPFASDQLNIQPDIICLSKALTAGMVPMSITACQDYIYKAFYDDDVSKGLFHAHTYTANPLACAVAIEALNLYNSRKIRNNIDYISKAHNDFIKMHSKHPKIDNIRSLGVILAVDVKLNISRYGSTRQKIYEYFLAKGIYLRPLGNTIYIVPPYTIKKKELQHIYYTIEDYINSIE